MIKPYREKQFGAPRMSTKKRGRPKGVIHGISGEKSGVMKTLKLMAEKARGSKGKAEGAKNPEIRQMAIAITQNCKVKDYKCEAASLLKWVQSNVRWVRDVTGVETVATPERTLEFGGGDCDDLSTLLAALGMSIGHTVRFKAIAADPNRKNSFSHVYCQFLLRGKWVSADPSIQRPKKKLGWESPVKYKQMEYPEDGI